MTCRPVPIWSALVNFCESVGLFLAALIPHVAYVLVNKENRKLTEISRRTQSGPDCPTKESGIWQMVPALLSEQESQQAEICQDAGSYGKSIWRESRLGGWNAASNTRCITAVRREVAASLQLVRAFWIIFGRFLTVRGAVGTAHNNRIEPGSCLLHAFRLFGGDPEVTQAQAIHIFAPNLA